VWVFERFTDRARRVLVSAQEEASFLHHNFIGTEHILLGLMREEDGVAAMAFQSLGISLTAVRKGVEQTIRLSAGSATGSPPFTPRAKKVLELSLRQALQLGHSYIGTEHMLLGLVQEGEGVAAQVLVSLGADMPEVRQQVIQLLPVHEALSPVEPSPTSGSSYERGTSAGRLVACSFCGIGPAESGRLVSGNNAFICEWCIRQWSERLNNGHHRDTYGDPLHPGSLPRALRPETSTLLEPRFEGAFSNLGMLSDDGQSVPSVERGETFGPTLVRAMPLAANMGMATALKSAEEDGTEGHEQL
jgi:Clp amino terminal domain, pathogenicity island component/ClpX C4-type zinc finger